MRRLLTGLLVTLVGGALFLGLTHQGQVAIKTAMLIPEVVPGVPARPLLWTSAEPLREEVTYSYEGEARSAVLLRPSGEGPYGAAIFSLGVDPDLEDPDFLRITQALARLGVVVLILRSDSLEEVQVSRNEVDAFVAAFQFLARQPYVDADRIGYVGICVGGSLSLLAATDPRIRDRVAFVNAFGAYYDILDLVSAVATRRISYEGDEEPWEPQPLTVDFLQRGVIGTLPSPVDRAILTRLLREGAPVTDEALSSLSADGRLAYDLLTSEDPQRVQETLGLLSEEVLQKLAAISPSQKTERLHTKVFLMHDRSDTLMPYVESRRLRDALQGQTELHHTELRLFEHVKPSRIEFSPTFAREVAKLFSHLYRVLLEVA